MPANFTAAEVCLEIKHCQDIAAVAGETWDDKTYKHFGTRAAVMLDAFAARLESDADEREQGRREVLAEVAKLYPYAHGGTCLFCSADEHAPTCLWLRAQQAVTP